MFRYMLTIFLFQGVGGGLGFLLWTNVFGLLRFHAFFVGFFFFFFLGAFICLLVYFYKKERHEISCLFFFFLQKHINPGWRGTGILVPFENNEMK